MGKNLAKLIKVDLDSPEIPPLIVTKIMFFFPRRIYDTNHWTLYEEIDKNHQIELKWNRKRLQNPFPLKLHRRSQVCQNAKPLPAISIKSLFLVPISRLSRANPLTDASNQGIVWYCGILAFCQSLCAG